MPKKRAVVTHWDLDGLASNVLISRYINPGKQVLSSVTSTFKYLKNVYEEGYDEIWVADLNPQPGELRNYEELFKAMHARGCLVRWLDHHLWPVEVEEAFSKFRDIVSYMNDPSTVAADLVANYLGVVRDRYTNMLIDLAFDDDWFQGRYELTTVYRRVLRFYKWDIRYRALESLMKGDVAPQWLLELYRLEVKNVYENLIREAIARAELVERRGVKILVFQDVDPRVHPGELIHVAEKNGIFSHVYIVRYPRGLSLRSEYIDVSKLALKYGGGGHRRIAGIPGKINLETLLGEIVKSVEESRIRSHYIT
ncbi:phosphoesterase DHHA1 [Desulfurococcus mucosus DSM 2162]|uniref:Phosphoesterase DHHA1 n=1 Tax=Desulfurococcus mucosus (strain ATCC 35584 / DSM 2162 / JCM 9187 / O7/1) TaxID=765177 RepID=E8R989_DESM0|nr:phosphohydrolase [Desulfurococcus mucosus]ADV65065.1 phosphoesterase DHHA1 [Desulfurococcus mucosus DSM 2162]